MQCFRYQLQTFHISFTLPAQDLCGLDDGTFHLIVLGLSNETQKALNKYSLIGKDDLHPRHFIANRQSECLDRTANRFRYSSIQALWV
ncbi:hypothetical protein Tco_1508857 [Tanacetum coccineum]